MKAILSLDGDFTEVIDLRVYVPLDQQEKIAALYQLHSWPLEPEGAWIWRFEDVCALYFRVRRHADYFGPDPKQAQLLYAIEVAITDSQEDEFA